MACFMWNSCPFLLSFLTLFKCCLLAEVLAMSWDHTIDLDEDFRILWTTRNQYITFEIQARTLGYVGLGFIAHNKMVRADVAVGWVDKGQTFFQDRYVLDDENMEPRVDPSQDYSLMMGYENKTHTVIRFRRKLQTCDEQHDVAITNDTMQIVYMYSPLDPKLESSGLAKLPNVEEAWRAPRSILLIQRPTRLLHRHERILELKNQLVELPFADDTLTWCRMFKMDKIHRKHHNTRFEPVFDSSWSLHYLQQITVYECEDGSADLEQLSSGTGKACAGSRSFSQHCSAVVASWTRGSEGFSYPKEAGFPLEAKIASYFLMETQYHNSKVNFEQLGMAKAYDSSGIRLYLTDRLRPYDAAYLSIGIAQNWRHIIPPGQSNVVSEGHCIEECTENAFPKNGINIFGLMMRSHKIGKEIKLRHIRNAEELPPIAQDLHIDSEFQEYRQLERPIRVLPGDRLTLECIYDSSNRTAITLGGLAMNEESCTVFTMYYPRQTTLTTCHSLPSLPTVLHSLGIEELATNTNSIIIASPPELKGMTLESRLLSYDWKNQFNTFQHATLEGSFQPICMGAKNEVLPVSEYLASYRANLVKEYRKPRHCIPRIIFGYDSRRRSQQIELPILHDIQSNNIYESWESEPVRSSRKSFIKTLALSSSPKIMYFGWAYRILLMVSTLR